MHSGEIGAFCAGIAIGCAIGALATGGYVADKTCAEAGARMFEGRCMQVEQATKAEALQRELAALKAKGGK